VPRVHSELDELGREFTRLICLSGCYKLDRKLEEREGRGSDDSDESDEEDDSDEFEM
jgi:hypothetical protein